MRIELASSDVTPLAFGALPSGHDDVAAAAFIANVTFEQLSLAPISSKI